MPSTAPPSLTRSLVRLLRSVSALPARGPMDWWILILSLSLVVFGLLMVSSSSAMVALEETGDQYFFFTRQALAAGVGLVGMLALARVPLSVIMRFAPMFFYAVLFGLALVLLFGHEVNGATRWLRLGVFKVQPSEFAKIALVLVLAHRAAAQPSGASDIKTVLKIAWPALPVMALIMLQPDFGTTAIILGMTFLILFLVRLPTRLWLGGSVLVVAALSLAVATSPYRRARVISWLDPWSDPQGGGYQVLQGWVALNRGGLTGHGLGNAMSKMDFLPFAYTDFVAAVVGEELGFLGLAFLIGLLGALVFRGIQVACRVPSLYGLLVAASISILLGIQALFNLGVLMGVLPPKGLVLPFVSYGFSALVAQLWSMGILLSISSEIPHRAVPGAARRDSRLKYGEAA